MFETGVRQFRMAMATVTGRRINPQVIERLAGDLLATLREFGAPGDDVNQLLDGPFADPEAREHFQTQAVRRIARRLVARSPFYAKRRRHRYVRDDGDTSRVGTRARPARSSARAVA